MRLIFVFGLKYLSIEKMFPSDSQRNKLCTKHLQKKKKKRELKRKKKTFWKAVYKVWLGNFIVRWISFLFRIWVCLLGHIQRKKHCETTLVIENFEWNLSMWKRNSLALGERITLIKASLSNLLVYFMSLVMRVVMKEKLDQIWRISYGAGMVVK